MKKLLIFTGIFCALTVNAQDYYINFTGTGASTNVSTVKVENLTSGTSLIINGNDILHLKALITGVNSIKDDQLSKIKIYPNPMSDNSKVEIYPPVAGDAVITVLDITGKPVERIQSYLENSRQDFNLAGLKTGFYIINVKSNNYQFSEKLLSNGQSGGTISIEKVNVIIQTTEEKAPEKVSKGLPATVDMAYTSGDRLKFTGISGNFSTVKTDIPTSDKTISFKFIYCTDADNNNYPVVEIGNQVWMAENLKTTRYNDGTVVSLVSDAHAWDLSSAAYCWYGNDEATYKDAYGALYNWNAIHTEKLCPAGWYQPTNIDWGVLVNYLTNNGYGFGGSGNDIAKSLAASTNWSASSIEAVGSIGNNLADNNSTGFTALPAGERTSSGEFHNIGDYAGWWGSYDRRILEPYSDALIGPYMFNRDTFVSTLHSSLASGHSVRCILGKSLTTAAVTNITQTTAISGGNIKNDAGAPVIGRGVCWSTSPNPTIAHNKTINGSGIGIFTSTISGISANTTYYIRAYATNSLGTTYGDEIIFKTYLGTLSDVDGNVYQTVKIGTQIWTAENLKTTRYNDSEIIPLAQSNTLTKPGYSWVNNDEANKDTYGALYNSYAVSTEKLCPAGWHVPSNAEWTILTDYLTNNGYGYGGSGNDVSKSMAAPSGWEAANYDGGFAPYDVGDYQSINNSSGFTGIPVLSKGFSNSAHWWTNSRGELVLFNDESTPRRMEGDGYGSKSIRCMQGQAKFLPALTTTTASNIAQTTATSGGNITSDSSSTITARGVCWSLSSNPTITNNKTIDGTGTGIFTSSITGLSPGRAYYVRAYATNSAGTNYGNEIIINTVVTDIDGNVYNTVKIGTQVWMVENLKTTRYRNGDLIGTTTPVTLDLRSENTPTYQWAWSGNESNVATYGRLYTWFAVKDSRNVCPDHWHVPTQAEWTTLTDYLGGQSISGGKLKEAGTTHWISPNTGATNETGFTALPGGYRLSSGVFGGLGSDGAWRSSTESDTNEDWTIGMGNSYTDAYGSSNAKRSGYSVRCLKDEPILPTINTLAVSSISLTSAIAEGNLISDGGTTVNALGICWSTSPNPTITSNRTYDYSETGIFTSSIIGLTPYTTYYLRAYATNMVGTSYGNELIFKTYSETLNDIDGNVYNAVTIGTQVWMVENLKTSKYSDGTAIPLVISNTEWGALSTPGYCWYNNDATTYKATYGALYNWYAVDAASNGGKNVCPAGWHIPAFSEWDILRNYLGGQDVAGNKLKVGGTVYWHSGNTATNESGFTALPGGYREAGFKWIGEYGYWWSSTFVPSIFANELLLGYYYPNAYLSSINLHIGLSVRCLKYLK